MGSVMIALNRQFIPGKISAAQESNSSINEGILSLSALPLMNWVKKANSTSLTVIPYKLHGDFSSCCVPKVVDPGMKAAEAHIIP